MPNRIIFVQKFKEAEVEVTVEQEAGLSQSGRAMWLKFCCHSKSLGVIQILYCSVGRQFLL